MSNRRDQILVGSVVTLVRAITDAIANAIVNLFLEGRSFANEHLEEGQ